MFPVNGEPSTVGALPPAPSSLWQRRFFIVLTILGWLALAGVIIWGVGKIITPLVLIGFSALLAYLIFPMVRFFERTMPRVLAILVSLLLLLVVMGAVIFFIVAAAVQQLGLLISAIQKVIQHPELHPQFQAVLSQLDKLGISKGEVQLSGQQIASYLGKAIGGVLPILGSIFLVMISLLLIATLAVYFMVVSINRGFLRKEEAYVQG